MQGVSHVAIGVRDMDRALQFYRDLLGLTVALDTVETFQRPRPRPGEPNSTSRRAVYLRISDRSDAGLIVLSQFEGPPSGEPLKMHQVGIHHFAFGVNDLEERVKKLRAAGVRIVMEPTQMSGEAYGEPHDRQFLTCVFQDPDGTYLQFDQRLN